MTIRKISNFFPADIVKNPRAIAEAELFNRHCLTLDELQQLQIKYNERLTNEHFSLNGAYPYLIDFINYVCTHHKDKIDRIDDDKETHYRIMIPKTAFIKIALGDYEEQKARLEKEIYRLLSDKDENNESMKFKILPLTPNLSIRTKPIRLDILYEEKQKLKQNQLSLKNVTGERVRGYAIEFYKPLWQSIVNNKTGRAWFPLPALFQAKMTSYIKQHCNDPEFKRYGNFGSVSNYRKLYLYLNLHDNSKSEEIFYDAIDLTIKAFPQNIQVKKTANSEVKYFIRNWYLSHQFFQKALRLFYRMGEAGLLEGVKLIPASVWYDKPLKKMQVRINRGKSALPDTFNNLVPASFEECD